MARKTSHLSLLTPYASFLIKDDVGRTLVVSDLHIGWEAALTEEGIHVPSQTDKLLKKVKTVVYEGKVDRLVVLGDVKHTVSKIGHEEWRDVPRFFKDICKVVKKVQVVPGNHDGDIEALLPESVDILSPRGVIINDVGLFHGHTWPDPAVLGCSTLVVGHVHPVVAFRDPVGFRITRQVWVRAPCDGELLARFVLRRNNVKLGKKKMPHYVLKDKFSVDLRAQTLVIMPSFNDFLGGQAVNRFALSGKRFKAFIGPVLRSGSVRLDQAELYLLDGTFLGSLSQLRRIR